MNSSFQPNHCHCLPIQNSFTFIFQCNKVPVKNVSIRHLLRYLSYTENQRNHLQESMRFHCPLNGVATPQATLLVRTHLTKWSLLFPSIISCGPHPPSLCYTQCRLFIILHTYLSLLTFVPSTWNDFLLQIFSFLQS